MYHFMTKDEYFSALNVQDIDAALLETRSMGLKHIQDACILHLLTSLSARKVAEIGGGHSRVLPYLAAKGWECWNIDPLEGEGLGPRTVKAQPGVSTLRCALGAFSPLIQDEFFDTVFSISVIEHIGNNNIENFFKDIFRIMKYGSISYHAIDVYLEDDEVIETTQRNFFVLEAALNAGFSLLCDEQSPEVSFQCRFATNPDLAIRHWNKIAPQLIRKRLYSQSVSLLLGVVKI